MWIQSVFNAVSQVSSSTVNTAAGLDSNDEWNEEQWKAYNKAAGAIVEPFAFPGGESEDEEFFYERTEQHGFGMVKANIDGIEDYDAWCKVIDLVDVMGY